MSKLVPQALSSNATHLLCSEKCLQINQTPILAPSPLSSPLIFAKNDCAVGSWVAEEIKHH